MCKTRTFEKFLNTTFYLKNYTFCKGNDGRSSAGHCIVPSCVVVGTLLQAWPGTLKHISVTMPKITTLSDNHSLSECPEALPVARLAPYIYCLLLYVFKTDGMCSSRS